MGISTRNKASHPSSGHWESYLKDLFTFPLTAIACFVCNRGHCTSMPTLPIPRRRIKTKEYCLGVRVKSFGLCHVYNIQCTSSSLSMDSRSKYVCFCYVWGIWAWCFSWTLEVSICWVSKGALHLHAQIALNPNWPRTMLSPFMSLRCRNYELALAWFWAPTGIYQSQQHQWLKVKKVPVEMPLLAVLEVHWLRACCVSVNQIRKKLLAPHVPCKAKEIRVSSVRQEVKKILVSIESNLWQVFPTMWAVSRIFLLALLYPQLQ